MKIFKKEKIVKDKVEFNLKIAVNNDVWILYEEVEDIYIKDNGLNEFKNSISSIKNTELQREVLVLINQNEDIIIKEKHEHNSYVNIEDKESIFSLLNAIEDYPEKISTSYTTNIDIKLSDDIKDRLSELKVKINE